MSTRNGKRGWFHDAWHYDSADDWQRGRVTAHEVPWITAEFLAKERKRIGNRWFRQGYLCEFVSSDEELFSGEDIEAAIMPEIFAFQHTIGI